MGEETIDESRTSSIDKAIEAISSLISLSHSIKSFTVKWQLIRTKLDDLYSGLASLSNLDSSSSEHDPSLQSLLSAVLTSLTACYDLAARCVDAAYGGGKLLMQSDLDVMASSLDRHARNLSRIYSAGILTRGFAIVVSKPSVGNACKEDMRFYVRDLMTRMKVGDLEMKRQALSKLNEAMEEDDRYVKIVVVEVSDLVCLLVGFLDSSNKSVQEESVKALFFISGFGSSYKSVLVRSGVVGPLVRVLENGSVVGREASAKCLMKLTENSENAWSVSAHGGVSALLKICSCNEFGGELIASSCGVLRNLVGVEEIKRFMIEEDDTMITFVKLIGSKEEIVQVNSIDLLLSMCAKDEQTREVLVRQGGIQELVSVLSDPNPSKSREIALRAIDNLCFGSPGCLNALMSCKFLDHLLYLLSNGEISVQESALKVTSRLCSLPEEVKRIMGDAGFMPELVKFLDAKSFDVREMASVALYCLISVPKNRKKFAQDDFNISYILKLLDREEGSNVSSDSGSNKFLISILMSLTSCNSARRKIASSGYLKSIEKLAETEGSDAKKLVKKLSMNRFRSMLSGIF